MKFNSDAYDKIYHPQPEMQTAGAAGGLVKPEPKKETKSVEATEPQKPTEPEQTIEPQSEPEETPLESEPQSEAASTNGEGDA